MKKILSFLLICSFCVSCFIITPVADETEETDTDVIIQEERDSFASPSSGTPSKWSSNYFGNINGTKLQSVSTLEDPYDTSNKVGAYKYLKLEGAGKTAPLIKKIGIDATDELVFSFDFLIPKESSSLLPCDSYLITLYGNQILKFSKQDSVYVASIFGNNVSTIDDSAWLHFSIHYTPSNVAGTEGMMQITLQSSMLKNTAGDSVLGISQTSTLQNKNTTTFQFTSTLPDAAVINSYYGFYLDNTTIYQPGSFDITSTEIELTTDAQPQPKLDGTLTLEFNHALDASTYVNAFKVYTEDSTECPITSISFDPGHPTTIQLHFDENPLPENEMLRILLPNALKDIAGKSLLLYEASLDLSTSDGTVEKLEVRTKDRSFVMPDAYNTGYRTELVPIGTKYPELSSSSTITDAIAKKYNYHFSGFTASIGSLTIQTVKPVYLEDFYLEASGFYGIINKGSATVYCSHFEGVGSLSSFFATENIHVSYAHIHDCRADILKGGGDNIIFEFCYFHDAGSKTPGAHADGIQFSGSTGRVFNNLQVIGCRFDMPQLLYDHLANCCFFFKPEKDTLGYTNVQAIGNWFNGGGYTTYITPAYIGTDPIQYLSYNDNIIGYGHAFGPYCVSAFTNENGHINLELTGGSFEGNHYMSHLEVGSIVYYDGETRVYSLEDMTSGTGSIFLNFANYMLEAHSYEISYVLLNAEGLIIQDGTQTGTIERYTPYKEYATKDNQETITVENSNGELVEVTHLIELPTFPSNVGVTIDLQELPEDLTGYTLSCIVKDTTTNEWIRSSTITTKVEENTIEELPQGKTYTVSFYGKDHTLIESKTVASGKSATAPTAPTLSGYRFIGWDKTFDSITGDLEVNALYELIPTYTVTYLNAEGATLTQETIEENSTIQGPEAPSKDGYVFAGWLLDGQAFDVKTKIQKNLTLQASYSKDLETFKKALQKIQSNSTLSEQHTNFLVCEKLLSLWGNEQTDLDEATRISYTTNKTHYTSTQSSIIEDLEVLENLF